VQSEVKSLPLAYKKVKHELKKEIKSAVKLRKIIAVILMFSATLEIWLVIG